MKRHLIILLASVLALAAMAQPSSLKESAKSIFTLKTFTADGALLASSHGVFVSADGEAVSPLEPFLGADRAVVIDAKGRQMDVTRFIGASDAYGTAHFRVDGKTTRARLAQAPVAEGSTLWLVEYALSKPAMTRGTVRRQETFMDGRYNYYIIDIDTRDNSLSYPFFNDSGEAVGLMQPSRTSADIHSTDLRYGRDLRLNMISFNDPTMRQIGIPLELPADLSEARVMLMMAEQTATTDKKLQQVADDFIRTFPAENDGYLTKARLLIQQGKAAEADAVLRESVDRSRAPEQAQYEYSRLMFDCLTGGTPNLPASWTLDTSMAMARTAYVASPQPLYAYHIAHLDYALGNYQQAYDQLISFTQDKSRFFSANIYSEAAMAKQKLGAPSSEIIELLDSALAYTDSTHIGEAASYILQRAEAYEQAEDYKQAVFDYNRFEYLMQGRCSAEFYYTRSQTEMKCKLYQPALQDIAHACVLDRSNPIYLAELTNLNIRFRLFDDAIKTARLCTETNPDYATGWLLLGLAQVQNGQKEEGLANMRKAQSLGDQQAAGLIEKYK